MTPIDARDLGANRSRQEASDYVGAAGDERAQYIARCNGVPVSQLRGIYGPACDATDPAEWAGDPFTANE